MSLYLKNITDLKLAMTITVVLHFVLYIFYKLFRIYETIYVYLPSEK